MKLSVIIPVFNEKNTIQKILQLIENQNFIEDCEVCCNPIDFHITIENNEVVLFNSEKIDQ